jgi:hypothetical protein
MVLNPEFDMNGDPKPWYTSQGVWGSGSAIVAALGAAYFAYTQKDMAGVSASLIAAAAAFHGLVGRLKATGPIGKALNVADTVIQTGAEFIPNPPVKAEAPPADSVQ